MGNYHALRFSGGSGGEDDLQHIRTINFSCPVRRRGLPGQRLGQVFKDQRSHRRLDVLPRTNQEFAAGLLMYTQGKLRRADIVQRYNNGPAQGTSQEGHDPLGGIWAPEQDAVVLADRAFLQFARKLKCSLGDLPIGPTNSAISLALNVGNLLPV